MAIRDYQIEIYRRPGRGGAVATDGPYKVDGYPSLKHLTPDAVSIEIGNKCDN